MAYSAFTLSKVKTELGISLREDLDLFRETPAIAPSQHLVTTLEEHLPLITAINTEKARSELAIMPVLIEVRRHLNYQASLFSGSEFNVDARLGLEGFCDFLLCQSPEQYEISRPVMMIVEAKNESIKSGLGQCIATMRAAQLFNLKHPLPTETATETVAETASETVYGAVTTGTDWKFLSLCGTVVAIDRSDYFIKEIDRILGILISTLRSSKQGSGEGC